MAHIHTEMHGHVLVVTLNRPEARNAFDRAMAETMEAVMDDYEGRPELRVAILRAEGPTFSAGQDLTAAERGEVATSSVRGAFGLFRKPPMKPLIAAVEGQALAGGMELNARLTQLEQGYDESRTEMHLDPANLRRVVDTALRINHQLPLIENHEFAQDTDAEVFTVPTLTTGWHDTLRGLATRLRPDELRPITFDAEAAEKVGTDLVYVHLGHPIVQKAQRLLRRSLWSVDSPLNRVTAVVVDDLEESFVAAGTRMGLVGRGGVRLHEEIFLAGVRLKGRRAMAEEKAEAALDKALDRERLSVADNRVRDQLCDEWNVPDAPLRLRLEESMQARAGRRHELVIEQLTKRQAADVQRAKEIFAAFRANLRDSLARLKAEEDEAQGQLFADPDQQRQWRRDIDAMSRRLDELDDEEAREIAAITERYADVKPHTTAAAVVFALTRADADGWAE